MREVGIAGLVRERIINPRPCSGPKWQVEVLVHWALSGMLGFQLSSIYIFIYLLAHIFSFSFYVPLYDIYDTMLQSLRCGTFFLKLLLLYLFQMRHGGSDVQSLGLV